MVLIDFDVYHTKILWVVHNEVANGIVVGISSGPHSRFANDTNVPIV
jgi:hypothetical protein